MPRNEIFISYSHHDRQWLDELLITLKPLSRKRKIDIWDDSKIGVGAEWRHEIAAALGRAKIAVLLVSRYFLYSEFIAEQELPPLLEAAKQDGLTIVWIAIGYSLYEQTEIASYQAANEPARPLNSLSESDRDLELVKIARSIDAILETDAQPTRNVTSPPTPKRNAPADVDRSADGADERIRKTLAEGKWAWRTIDVLATKAGITRDEALRIIRLDPEIELSKGKSGSTIARLQARAPFSARE